MAVRATRGSRGGTPRPSIGDARSRGGIQIVGLHEFRARVRMIRRMLASKPFRPRSDQMREIRRSVMESWRRAWDSDGASLVGWTSGRVPWAPHDLVELGKLRAAAVDGKPMPRVRKDGTGTVYVTVSAYSAQWALRWGEYRAIDGVGREQVGLIYCLDMQDRILGMWGGLRGRS